MAAGKTTLGKRIAKEKTMDFIDLDSYIEAQEKCTISEIFSLKGETHFRTLERNYLHQTSVLKNTVISCGGGTPCFYDNMLWMNTHGETIFINTPITQIISRLKNAKIKRPLIENIAENKIAEKVIDLYEQRLPFYNQAQEVYFK